MYPQRSSRSRSWNGFGAQGLIAETLALAQRLSARGRAAYDEDEVLRLAAEALVSRLGEGASRLSEGFKASHPEVPWRQIIGARNIVAHEYHRIDAEMLWNSVSVAMPSLAAALGADLADVTGFETRQRSASDE